MIVRLATPEDMPAVQALRHEVFVVGQGVAPEVQRDDEGDATADHAVALTDDGVVVGTGRLLPNGTIGRMAVSEHARGHGVGAMVLKVLEDRARERGFTSIELHAQEHAVGFYDKAGYVPFTDVYLEAGIEHRSMRKVF